MPPFWTFIVPDWPAHVNAVICSVAPAYGVDTKKIKTANRIFLFILSACYIYVQRTVGRAPREIA